MRFYGFGNYYLSSLQQGLQAGHLVGEIANAERTNPDSLFYNWSQNHKTMVLLNGGNCATLAELFRKFEEWKNLGMNLPYAKFHEDEQSLNGALTYVGIILEEKYYNAMNDLRIGKITMNELVDFKYWELELVSELKNYELAK